MSGFGITILGYGILGLEYIKPYNDKLYRHSAQI